MEPIFGHHRYINIESNLRSYLVPFHSYPETSTQRFESTLCTCHHSANHPYKESIHYSSNPSFSSDSPYINGEVLFDNHFNLLLDLFLTHTYGDQHE